VPLLATSAAPIELQREPPTTPVSSVPALSVPRPSTPVVDEAERAARRAARARKRRLQRIGWIGLGIGVWIGLIVGVLYAAELTGMHALTEPAPPSTYSNPLTGQPAGWGENDGCSAGGDAYHVAPPGNSGLTCFAPAGRYTSVFVQVTAQLSSGSASGWYGVAFRQADLGDAYIFAINASGQASVLLISNGTVSQLSDTWAYATRPNMTIASPTNQHELAVEAKGSTITCSVDGTQVGTLNDAHYAVGAVGLYADPVVDAAFTNFSVKAE
jgi:hypothetical protein